MNKLTPSAPRALVVDDDLVVRIALVDYLEEAGFEVEEAENGAQCLAAFEAQRPDILLLDVSLPDADGLELCEQIRARTTGAHLPIVMITGRDDLASVERAYRAGATDFIIKPLNFNLLIHRLQFVMRAQQTAEQLRQSQSNLAHAQRIARLGAWEYNFNSGAVTGSDEVGQVLAGQRGWLPATPEDFLARVCAEDRERVREALSTGVRSGEAFDIDFRVANGSDDDVHAHLDVEYLRDGAGHITRMRGSLQDVTEHRATQARIHELAFYDAVTGLPNRTYFRERLSASLAIAERRNRRLALLFVDLDQFKRINDSWGHHVGDELLCQVAGRLGEALRRSDVVCRFDAQEKTTLARLGGDEFVILLNDIERPENAGATAQRVLDQFKQPFMLDGNEVFVSGSIGIAVYPDDATDEHTLLKHGDLAMYQVKQEGRNGYSFFTADMNTRAMERLNMEASLRRAVEREEFRLFYQPKIAAASGEVIGAEALIRWQHPDLGLIGPQQFIPIAEDCGVIVAIGTWVIHEACRQLAAWSGDLPADFQMSVNLSAAQFAQTELVEVVDEALATAGVAPAQLQLELTETMLMGDVRRALQLLHSLRDRGVALAIDDFGTGYSSLNYLKRLPITCLKIDRSFVRDVNNDPRDAAIVRSTVALAHNLGLSVVAEGIETEQQRDALISFGGDELQGYLYSPPLPPPAFIEWLNNYRGARAPLRRVAG
ncbi:MAG: EAL domain-containing protein [Gammaproteobacteria bacterium]|nr:EAL domain-containing protein [Gammaproteobacteria bacterium]